MTEFKKVLSNCFLMNYLSLIYSTLKAAEDVNIFKGYI